jgi:hypothetical protein
MSRFLVVLAVVFFSLSMYDVYEMRSFIRGESSESVGEKVSTLVGLKEKQVSPGQDVGQQALLLLEADALDKRYRQASAMLMSRIWTRQLAFLTGMMLSFIGAVFIIGRLSEMRTDMHVGASDWRAGISSSSPGLILAFFGTVLMGIALLVQPPIDIQDRPVYLMGAVNRNAAKSPSSGAAKSSPDPFPDAIKQQGEKK